MRHPDHAETVVPDGCGGAGHVGAMAVDVVGGADASMQSLPRSVSRLATRSGWATSIPVSRLAVRAQRRRSRNVGGRHLAVGVARTHPPDAGGHRLGGHLDDPVGDHQLPAPPPDPPGSTRSGPPAATATPGAAMASAITATAIRYDHRERRCLPLCPTAAPAAPYRFPAEEERAALGPDSPSHGACSVPHGPPT